MSNKSFIWLGIFFGGLIGSYIPTLFGAGLFSFSSMIWSTIGSIVGIWIVFKMTH